MEMKANTAQGLRRWRTVAFFVGVVALVVAGALWVAQANSPQPWVDTALDGALAVNLLAWGSLAVTLFQDTLKRVSGKWRCDTPHETMRNVCRYDTVLRTRLWTCGGGVGCVAASATRGRDGR